MTTKPFPPRDTSIPAEQQGIFNKFNVTRNDGSSEPGGKHEHCRYFVIDMDHDEHRFAAMSAYAEACRKSHPVLSEEIRAEFGRVFAFDEDTRNCLRRASEILRQIGDKNSSKEDPYVALMYYEDAEIICNLLKHTP